jgi:hypothetical protein
MPSRAAVQYVPMASAAEIYVAGGIVIALYGGIVYGLFRLAKLIHGAV